MFDTGKTTKITVTKRGVGGGLKGVDHNLGILCNNTQNKSLNIYFIILTLKF